MPAIANIYAELGLNSAKFKQSLDKTFKNANKKTSQFQRKNKAAGRAVGNAMKAGFAVATAAVVATSLVVKKTASEIDELAKKSDRLNVPIDKLIGLEHAASLSGVAVGTLEKGMVNLNKAAKQAGDGSATYGRIFDELKISTQEFLALSPDKQLNVLADSLKGVESEQRKLAIATELFGSRGTRMINLLKGGSEALNEAQKEAEQLGLTLNRLDAAKVEAMNDAMNKASKATKGFFNRLTVELSPAITAIGNMFVNNAKASKGFSETAAKGAGIVTKAIGFIGDALEVVQRLWLEFRRVIALGTKKIFDGLNKFFSAIDKVSKKLGVDVFGEASKAMNAMSDIYDDGITTVENRIREFDKKRIFEGNFSERFKEEMQSVKNSIKETQDAANKKITVPLAIKDVDNKSNIINFKKAQEEKAKSQLTSSLQSQQQSLSILSRYRQETKELEIAALERSGSLAEAEKLRYKQQKILDQQRFLEAIAMAGENDFLKDDIRKQRDAFEKEKKKEHEANITEIERQEAEKRAAIKLAEIEQLGSFFRTSSGLFKKNSKAQKAALAAEQGVALAKAGMSLGVAIGRANEVPFPANVLAIAKAALQGKQAIEQIKSAGSFEQGGIVGGNSYTGDKLTANVNSGEMIINRQQQKRLFEQSNGKVSSGDINLTVINNGQPARVESVKRSGQDIKIVLEAVKNEMAKDMAANTGFTDILGQRFTRSA